MTGFWQTKVFHAARQDLEIFHKNMGDMPKPVFDTQVAAMVCGFGDQAAYDTLAAKLAKAGIGEITRALWPLLTASIVALFIITYVPSLTTVVWRLMN